MTVTAIEVTDTTVVVIAPEASLDEGEVWTERKSPCWNPPCRRVVLTMALNGVDFVGGATEDASEFFFFIDPPRYPFPGALLWTEFWMYVGGLLGLQLLNILIVVLPLPALRPLAQAQVLREEQDGLQEEHPGRLLDPEREYLCVPSP